MAIDGVNNKNLQAIYENLNNLSKELSGTKTNSEEQLFSKEEEEQIDTVQISTGATSTEPTSTENILSGLVSVLSNLVNILSGKTSDTQETTPAEPKDVVSSFVDNSNIIYDYTELFDEDGKYVRQSVETLSETLSSQAKKDLLLDVMETYVEGGKSATNNKYGSIGRMMVDLNCILFNSNGARITNDSYIQFTEEEYEKFQTLVSQWPNKTPYVDTMLSNIEKYCKPQNITANELQNQLSSGKEIVVPCVPNPSDDEGYQYGGTKNSDYVTVKEVNGELIYSCGIIGGELNLNEEQIQALIQLTDGKGVFPNQGLAALQYLTGKQDLSSNTKYSFTNAQGVTSTFSTVGCSAKTSLSVTFQRILQARAWVKDTLNGANDTISTTSLSTQAVNNSEKTNDITESTINSFLGQLKEVIIDFFTVKSEETKASENVKSETEETKPEENSDMGSVVLSSYEVELLKLGIPFVVIQQGDDAIEKYAKALNIELP